MKQKIVFLDASTVDYGDLDLSLFRKHGEFIAYPSTEPGQRTERLKGATVVITNKVLMDRDSIMNCDSLKFIAVTATGYNNIDIGAARLRGISVSNVAGYSTPSVAQFTLLFILALASRLIDYNAAAHDGRWSASPTFTMTDWPTMDIAGKVLGILGLGDIGGEVARLARAFGMEIVALGRPGVSYSGDIPRLGLFELAGKSDFVSIHMPLTPETRHIISTPFFHAMKRTASLINMARGPLVDPAALKNALDTGLIAGAALDVMEQEPPDSADPLLGTPNLIITPHIAWGTRESRYRLIMEIDKNIEAYLSGEPRNLVS